MGQCNQSLGQLFLQTEGFPHSLVAGTENLLSVGKTQSGRAENAVIVHFLVEKCPHQKYSDPLLVSYESPTHLFSMYPTFYQSFEHGGGGSHTS